MIDLTTDDVKIYIFGSARVSDKLFQRMTHSKISTIRRCSQKSSFQNAYETSCFMSKRSSGVIQRVFFHIFGKGLHQKKSRNELSRVFR